MPSRRLNPYIERVHQLENAAIEASYRVEVAHYEYETAMIELARGVEKMQWVNTQQKREWAVKRAKRRLQKQIYNVRKAG